MKLLDLVRFLDAAYPPVYVGGFILVALAVFAIPVIAAILIIRWIKKNKKNNQ